MKYIVLSFDDGFNDFKKNALPILKKHNLKATINVVSGFADGSLAKDKEKYLSNSDILSLYNEGFEIANHSNSHLEKTTIDDYEIAYEKMSKLLGEKKLGAIIPFSQRIPLSLLQYFIDNHYLYVSDYGSHKVKRNLKLFFNRLINKIKKTELRSIIVGFQYYLYKPNDLKGEIAFFQRLPATRRNSPKLIINFIKNMNDNACLTIVFHSIVNNINDKVDWPEGTWTKDEFNTLILFLSNCQDVNVLTQKELVDFANGN